MFFIQSLNTKQKAGYLLYLKERREFQGQLLANATK